MFVSLCTRIRRKIVLNCQGYVNSEIGKEFGCEAKNVSEKLFHCMCYQKVGKDKIVFSFDDVVRELVISASQSLGLRRVS